MNSEMNTIVDETILTARPKRVLAVAVDEDLAPSKLLDGTKINKSYNYNNLYVYKLEMDETVDLSSLTPTKTESFDQFGGSIYKTFYSISKVPRETNIKQIEKVTKRIGSEVSQLLPGYRYFIASNKVEIYNKDLSNLNYISCKLTINHEKKTIYNNLIFA